MSEHKSTTPPIGERLLTLREAAEVLRLSSGTVREYVHLGEKMIQKVVQVEQ